MVPIIFSSSKNFLKKFTRRRKVAPTEGEPPSRDLYERPEPQPPELQEEIRIRKCRSSPPDPRRKSWRRDLVSGSFMREQQTWLRDYALIVR